MLQESNIKFILSGESKNVIELLLNIVRESRTDFIHFNKVKQIQLKYSIDIILDLCVPNEEGMFNA